MQAQFGGLAGWKGFPGNRDRSWQQSSAGESI